MFLKDPANGVHVSDSLFQHNSASAKNKLLNITEEQERLYTHRRM